ncbi:MAG TPA: hypothetical protein VEB20_25835 [Azospirillaceae bacterium]|nr:hypothetical protein [Azospirillaceae bacterium]
MDATLTLARNVQAAANLHIDIIDEFISIVRGKMADTAEPFVRDSLNELLVSLREQRDAHLLMAEPLAA